MTTVRRLCPGAAVARGAVRAIAACALLSGVAAAVAITRVQAQAPSAQSSTDLRFDVASIKPNKKTFQEHFAGSPGGAFSGMRALPGGRMEASYMAMRALIMRAYEVRSYQLEGGPAWLDDERYDIQATAGREVTPAEMNAMIRTLLAERFKLRARTVDREMPVYAIVLARADGRLGSGLSRTSDDCVANMARQKAEGIRPTPPRPDQQEPAPICGLNWVGSGTAGGRRLSWGGTTMAGLLNFLGAEFDGPLQDRTGLDGMFDVVLEFQSTAMERLGRAAVAAEPTTAPALRDALVNQLGLRVERTTGTVPVVVIDSIERPTPD